MANPSEIEEILQKELNTTKLQDLGCASGGCINEGQSYDTDCGKVFVKFNTKSKARKVFDGEISSLKAILETSCLRVPKPIKVFDHPSGSGAVFVMEHFEMRPLRKHQALLGTQLGRLHLHNIKKLQKAASKSSRIGGNENQDAVEKFGFGDTTCCGYIGQINDWQDDWVTFYTRQRLHHQMDLINKEYGDSEARSLWSRLQLKIPEFFKNVDIKPSLLHGDLWSGNAGEMDTEPVAFDPASFYGHHEYDLAIAGMFGGFSKAFYDSYHKEIPKEKGFDKRHQLYLLFHNLNHWNHFGASYRSSSITLMNTLLKN